MTVWKKQLWVFELSYASKPKSPYNKCRLGLNKFKPRLYEVYRSGWVRLANDKHYFCASFTIQYISPIRVTARTISNFIARAA